MELPPAGHRLWGNSVPRELCAGAGTCSANPGPGRARGDQEGSGGRSSAPGRQVWVVGSVYSPPPGPSAVFSARAPLHRGYAYAHTHRYRGEMNIGSFHTVLVCIATIVPDVRKPFEGA